MSIGGWFQKQLTKLALMNKEKLIALALERLNEEYVNNRLEIARSIVEKLPSKWHDTATSEETAHLIDITKKYIEDAYVAIQAMRSPPSVLTQARKDAQI